MDTSRRRLPPERVAGVEEAPTAGLEMGHEEKAKNDGEVLDEVESVTSRIVASEVLDHQLPRQGKVGVKREPP